METDRIEYTFIKSRTFQTFEAVIFAAVRKINFIMYLKQSDIDQNDVRNVGSWG